MKVHKHTDHPFLSKRAFWDVDLRAVDFTRHAGFVILRVFERGSTKDTDALIQYFGEDKVKDTLTKSKSLMPLARERAKQAFKLSDQDFACYRSKLPARNLSRF